MTDPDHREPVDRDPELMELSYSEALEELVDILAELESSAVDVDLLAERVARGAVLVRYCRQRLRVVRSDVSAVVDDLLDEVAEAGGSTDDLSDASEDSVAG